jgi:ATP-binding cassette, subfamily C, bacterial
VRLWLAVALLLALSALEASGLLMLPPLLQAVGLSRTDQIQGLAGAAAARLHSWGVPLTLPFLLGLFVALKLAQGGLRMWSGVLNTDIENRFICFLRDRFYRAMMQADWLTLTRQRSSDITQALVEELSIVSVGTQQLLMLLSVALTAFVYVAIALSLSPVVTALAIGSGAIVALPLHRLRGRSYGLNAVGAGKRPEMAAAITEHLAGMKIAKSHGREARHFDHFNRVMGEISLHRLRAYRLNAITRLWLEVGGVIALSLFVYLAVDIRHINAAQLLVLIFIFSRLLGLASTLQTLGQQVARALPSFARTEKMRELFISAAEPAAGVTGQRIELDREIRFEHVTFRYDVALPATALRDLDLVVPARRVTAFCGPSGAGKSTLADLLLGLLRPTSGRVLLDGQELAARKLHDWRQSVGYVPQETFLFHESVRANLLWAQPDATTDDLRAALRAAAAEEFVDRLPHGLDTIVGDRGVRLSGGERQRIALARALLRRPALLILDEATSALDNPNERLVQEAIEKLHGELTIVLIAHRLSTVRMADRIVVLEAGAVVETGTWEQLTSRADSAFQRLVTANATV